MKKSIISLLTVLILIVSLTSISYADTGSADTTTPTVPKAVAVVNVDNTQCEIFDQIPKNLKVAIYLDNGETLLAEIPVEKIEEENGELALWLGYDIGAPFTEEAINRLEEIQKELVLNMDGIFSLNEMTEEEAEAFADSMIDMGDVLEKVFAAYTVTVIGLPDNSETHKFETEAETIYLSSAMAKELINFFKEMIGELFQLTQAEIDSIESFSDMVKLLEEMLVESGLLEEGETMLDFIYDGEATETVKVEYQKSLKELDEMVKFIKSEEYKGTVIAIVDVSCGCPEEFEYEIIHQYFKIKGDKATLVASEMYGPEDGYYIGMTGDTIYAKDYIRCEYNGKKYNYIGSYDSVVELYDQEEVDEYYFEDSWWDEDQMDSFVLTYDDWEAPVGLVLRYELMEEETVAGHDEKPAVEKVDKSSEIVDTGDDMDALPFIILLAASVIAMATVLFTRRKNI